MIAASFHTATTTTTTTPPVLASVSVLGTPLFLLRSPAMPPAPPPTPPSASLLATPSALDACLTVADARAADLGPASGPGVYAYVVLSLPPTAEPPVDLLASDVGTIPDVCAYLSDPAQVRFVLLRDQHALLLVQFLGAHVAYVPCPCVPAV